MRDSLAQLLDFAMDFFALNPAGDGTFTRSGFSACFRFNQSCLNQFYEGFKGVVFILFLAATPLRFDDEDAVFIDPVIRQLQQPLLKVVGQA
jgi:hypothetical protein